MLRTPVECVDMTVWEPVSRSILPALARVYNPRPYYSDALPPHFPVETAGERFVVVASKADI
jgi:hypothetical protein